MISALPDSTMYKLLVFCCLLATILAEPLGLPSRRRPVFRGCGDPAIGRRVCARARGSLAPHPYDCRLFYYCAGKPVCVRCPRPLHFDPVRHVCDWPQNAGCSPSTSTSADFSTTSADSSSTRVPITSTPEPTATETTSEYVTDTPSSEAPSSEAPSSEAPSSEAPSSEAPASEAPSTEEPSSEAPASEAPSSEAPSSEAPASEAPSTEEPSSEAPSTSQ